MMPTSVMIEVTSAAGVTSKAGAYTSTPRGAVRWPNPSVISSAGRSSMGMRSPLARDGSTVESGATTWKGTPWWRAAMATP